MTRVLEQGYQGGTLTTTIPGAVALTTSPARVSFRVRPFPVSYVDWEPLTLYLGFVRLMALRYALQACGLTKGLYLRAAPRKVRLSP